MKLVSDIFTIHNNKILIVKADYRATWQFPGGHIGSGETPMVAAKREGLEEIGAGVRVRRLLCVHTEMDQNAQADAMCFLFAGEYDGATPITVDGQEIHEYAWVNVEDAEKMLNPLVGILVPHAMRAINEDRIVYLEGGVVIE